MSSGALSESKSTESAGKLGFETAKDIASKAIDGAEKHVRTALSAGTSISARGAARAAGSEAAQSAAKTLANPLSAAATFAAPPSKGRFGPEARQGQPRPLLFAARQNLAYRKGLAFAKPRAGLLLSEPLSTYLVAGLSICISKI